MIKCNTKQINFSPIKSKRIEYSFTGGNITSDGGVILLRQVDKKLKLTEQATDCIPDKRNPNYVTYSTLEMLRQRVYGIALGYEDLNDHDKLKDDGAIQTAIDFEHPLASSPILCRFENRADREAAVKISRILVESFKKPPQELILDFDATDYPVHGNQEGKFYHGYYRKDCFLPLHVFCGSHLLVSYLRRSSEDQAKHSWTVLSLLVKRLRQVWPDCSIIFRADSGFCRHKIFDWCEKNQVDFVVGIAGNKCLKREITETMNEAEKRFKETQEKQRLFTSFLYAAKS